MTKFKKGDKVRCINLGGTFTGGDGNENGGGAGWKEDKVFIVGNINGGEGMEKIKGACVFPDDGSPGVFEKFLELADKPKTNFTKEMVILLGDIYVQNEITNERILDLLMRMANEDEQKEEDKKEPSEPTPTSEETEPAGSESIEPFDMGKAIETMKKFSKKAKKSEEPVEKVESDETAKEVIGDVAPDKVWCGVCKKEHTRGTHD